MQSRRKTQRGGAKHPTKPMKYTPMRKQIVGVSKILTRKKSMHPGTRKSKSILDKFLPNIPFLMHDIPAAKKQFEYSLSSINGLLTIYKKSPTLSDESQNAIYNFMMVLNAAIREKAAELEPDLRVYFSSGTVEKITEESSTNLREVEKQLKECLSFMNKLNSRLDKTTNAKKVNELAALLMEFYSVIQETVRSQIEEVEEDNLDDLVLAFRTFL